MSAQANITAKTLISAYTLTGASLTMSPRGRDQKNVMKWIAPGATTLQDASVDFSYRLPTATRKSVKATLRTFSPKTFVDASSVTQKLGDMIMSTDFTALENATAAERKLVLDLHISALCDAAVQAAIVNGDVPY